MTDRPIGYIVALCTNVGAGDFVELGGFAYATESELLTAWEAICAQRVNSGMAYEAVLVNGDGEEITAVVIPEKTVEQMFDTPVAALIMTGTLRANAERYFDKLSVPYA